MRKRVYYLLTAILALSTLIPSANAATISGYIQDAVSGIPITQLDINLYDENWNYLPIDTATGGTGIYTLYNVPAGAYFVKANPKWPHHYLAEYWDDSLDRTNATPITVQENEDLTGIDFELTYGYYIGGKILNLDAEGVGSIDVNVYDPDWNKMDVDTSSDLAGRYFIGGLPPGDYYVMADPVYAQPYLDQYWDHADGPNYAIIATITPPDDMIGINFDLESGSYIEGNILNSETQQPISGMPVKVFNSAGQKMRVEGRSKTDGHYVVGAFRAGEYIVRTDPSYPSGYMDVFYDDVFTMSEATFVTTTPPKPSSGIDFQNPPGSYIRGLVTDGTSSPLADIKMKFYNEAENLFELAVCYTKPDGSFISGALKTGIYFVKATPIYPQHFVDEYYNNAVEFEDATQVSISLGTETTGINFSLIPGGYLSGTIRADSTGDPIPDCDLDVYDSQWTWVDYSDISDSEGFFLIGAMPFGSYYLHADPSSNQGYSPEFYNGAFWRQDATVISISDGHDPQDINFSLRPGGKISGRIIDVDAETPLEGIHVEVYSQTEQLLPIRIVDSKGDGTYISHGIPSGSYYIKAAPDEETGYASEYYREATGFDDATLVAVEIGNTTSGIDFTLKGSPKPTPTPPVSLGVELDIPSTMFHPDDPFYLGARIGNPGAPLGELPLFVILEAMGEFYFWPTWIKYAPPDQMEMDFSYVEIGSGILYIPIIPTFNWPDTGSSNMSGFKFYGAITSNDFSGLVGDFDIVEFGYGP